MSTHETLPRSGLAIPPFLETYHGALFKTALREAFPANQILRADIATYDDGSPISLVGKARDKVVLFGLHEGDNWRQSFADMSVLAQAYTYENPYLGKRTNEVVTYFVDLEARGDRVDEMPAPDSMRRAVVEGQGIPILAFANSLRANGVTTSIGVNGHSHHSHELFISAGIEDIQLSTEGVFIDRLIELGYLDVDKMQNLVLGTTDSGGLKEAATAQRFILHKYGIHVPLSVVEKVHFGDKKVSQFSFGDVKGKDVAIIDDRTDSGDSIANAVREYINAGATRVYIYIVHPVFGRKRYYKIFEGLLGDPRVECIFISNSLPMEKERTSRDGGLETPYAIVGDGESEHRKYIQTLNIFPFIIETTRTILTSSTISEAVARFEEKDQLLDMRDPLVIFEEASGVAHPHPQIVGSYRSGKIYQFPKH